MMEMTSGENSQPSAYVSNDDCHNRENMEPHPLNHGDAEMKCEITEVEVRGILEVIAATGKFWHDWDMLKSLLSFQLKQVLSEYAEAQMVPEQQASSLGETFPELVKRLDEALHSFIEGPPFTLQRLCEILLTSRSVYPNLSKLALALEKNLLVTSTLTISTDPYPSTMKPGSEEPEKESSPHVAHSDAIQNGVEAAATGGDEDEEMADAEPEPEPAPELEPAPEPVPAPVPVQVPVVEAEAVAVAVGDSDAEAEAVEVEEGNKNDSNIMETVEETSSGTSETSSDQSTNSELSGDSSPSSEQQQKQLNLTS